jgi:competence protein ComEA
MGSRRPSHDQVAAVARRRLEQLGAELAADFRGDPADGTDVAERALPPVTPVPAEPPAGPGAPRSGPLAPGSSSAPDGEPGLPSASMPGRHARRSMRPLGTVVDWLRDRLPPALQDRVAMRGRHVAVVALLVLVGATVTFWWVARAGGSTTTLPPVSSPPSPLVSLAPTATGSVTTPSAAGPASPAGAARTAAPSAGVVPGTGAAQAGVAQARAAQAGAAPTGVGTVVVDVAGKVRRPGIATLPLGSRVADALRAAGGARRGVRLGALNLARVLVDGEQILVGVRAPPGSAAAAAAAPPTGAGSTGTTAPTALVDINTASSTELEALPEVGPVTAQAIVDFRTQNGPFTSVDELLEVSGIGDATLAKVAPFVTL